MPSPDMQANWNGAHPDEGMLHEWLEEQLSVEDAARVAAHVASCAECRERVAEAHGLIAASRRILSALDGVPAGVIPARAASLPSNPPASSQAESSRAASSLATPSVGTPVIALSGHRAHSFRWRRWGAMAAVLLLGVTGIVVVNQGDRARVLPSSVMAPASVPDSEQTRAADRAAPPAAPVAEPVKSAGASQAAAPVAASKSRDVGATPPSVAPPASPPAAQLPVLQGKREAAGMAVSAKSAPMAASIPAGDTLAARLEAERKRRMASEAVTADASMRPRLDALGAAASGNAFVPQRQAAGGSSPAPAPFDSLVLTREPCFGSCPWYDLYVDGTGHVRYQSHHLNDTTSEKRALLSTAELGRLRALLERANVETLKSYVSGTPECGLSATDMPSLRLRVFQRGRWYRVEQYQGCRLKTTVLPDLMREIDAIVGTQRWLPPGVRLN